MRKQLVQYPATIKNIGKYPEVPGLTVSPPIPAAPRQSNDAPYSAPAAPRGPGSPGLSDPAVLAPCARCASLEATISLTFEKLRSAQRFIDGAIIMGKEAAERSAARVGAYDVLQTVQAKYGVPFQDSDRLPLEYQEYFPRHARRDEFKVKKNKDNAQIASGVAKGILSPTKKRAEPAASEGPAAMSRHAGSGDGDDSMSSESEESIPPCFQPRDIDSSNMESLSDGESSNAEWELDAEDTQSSDAEASEMESH